MKPVSLKLSAWLLGVGLAVAATAGHAQRVVRGPYLQLSTENSVVVKWRTDVATESAVRYGTAQGALASIQMPTGTRTEHEVTVAGLAADTKYFYSVGSVNATLAGNDANHFLRTHPAQGTAKPLRIWVLGDAGRGDANQRAVRDAYINFTAGRGTDLGLLLGDNAYEDGTDSEYQTKHFDIYQTVLRNTVLWSTRGNHERNASVYYGAFAMPTAGQAGGVASGTEAYHSFNVGNIHFINLDSYLTNRSASGAMATWLRNDLAGNTLPWVIAFWHHPPYTKGSHDSDSEAELIDMRQNIVPILEQYGVDLVLTGHSHSYERSFLIDGHYGNSSTFTAAMKKDGGSGRADGSGAYAKPNGMLGRQGAVYAVAGSSGAISGGSLNHPAMYISLNRLGSMVLDVNANQLDAKFIRENGAVDDYFTINKGNAAPTVSLTAPAGGASYTAPATIALAASASDVDGSIARVEFYNGSTLLASDVTAPYTHTWSNVPAGSYSLSAKAFDDKGASRSSSAASVTVGAPNTPPTVSLTSPASGATFTAPASVSLAASAADSNGSVVRVEFYNGGTLIGTDTTAPYSLSWNNVAAGSYALTARAIDNGGAGSASAPVSITVNAAPNNVPPTVAISSPANGAAFTAPASFMFNASAADSDGTIARVEFRRDGALLASDTSAPYSVAVSGLAAGSYALTATAVDNVGASRSASATITVNAAGNVAPTVSLTSPGNGAVFTAPAAITLGATAADSNGSVVRVDFFRNGTLIGSDTTSPYGLAWSGVAAGSYTLTARATDNAGAATTSAAVAITVNGGGGTTGPNFIVSSAYDQKNNKTYRPGGPDGADPVVDLNGLSDQLYKVEVEPGYYWDIHYADAAATLGTPTQVLITLVGVPEESWSGSFTAQFIDGGGAVLASAVLPLDSRKDAATGKGQRTSYVWNLSTAVPDIARLNAGKVRVRNNASNGKKAWITYSLEQAAFTAP